MNNQEMIWQEAEKTDDMLRVGVFTSTHGVRGEIKVFPTTDDPERYEDLEKVFLDTGKKCFLLQIERVRFAKNQVILKFKGIDNINDIEKYKGCDLLIAREDAVELEDGEFFICDAIGCEVFEEDGKKFGVLKEVMETKANDVFIVETTDGKEVLLPYIDDCIKEVNVEEKKIIAYIMPGLLD